MTDGTETSTPNTASTVERPNVTMESVFSEAAGRVTLAKYLICNFFTGIAAFLPFHPDTCVARFIRCAVTII